MPHPLPHPPVIAEARSPFTTLRVASLLLARPRGVEDRIAAITDALNAAHLDWMFEARVVADELLQLQANWFGDFRTAAGFVVADGAAPGGATLQLEDSPQIGRAHV